MCSKEMQITVVADFLALNSFLVLSSSNTLLQNKPKYRMTWLECKAIMSGFVRVNIITCRAVVPELCVRQRMRVCTYRVIQEESALLLEMIV